MNTRTTRLAAAGLLAVTLPFSGSAEAATLYRFDQPRAHHRSSDSTSTDGTTLHVDTSALSTTLRSQVTEAVASGQLAARRAYEALAVLDDDDAVAWTAVADLADAEVGLEAASAQVGHTLRQLDGLHDLAPGATWTLRALYQQIDGLRDDLASAVG